MWAHIITIVMNLPAILEQIANLVEIIDDAIDGEDENKDEVEDAEKANQ